MKSFAAAAVLLCAHSEDVCTTEKCGEETSLMQGLLERHSKLSAAEGGTSKDNRRESTARLMETATKMIKSGVTPDVVDFIDETILEVNQNVLPAITREYQEDQDYIDAFLQRLQDAADAIPEQSFYDQQAIELARLNTVHKQCRADEALACAHSRKCEAELIILWNRVKTEETEMRRIHDAIHGEWCLRDGFNPHPPTPDCWDWTLANHWEGPETSQSVVPYCVTDVTAEQREFRLFSIEHFSSYIHQKGVVFAAWEAYNAKIILCAGLEETLDNKVIECDASQVDLHSDVCLQASENRAHRKTFGHEWHAVLAAYRIAVGDCRLSAHEDDPYDVSNERCNANELRYHDIDLCKCTGILQEEKDRKREWETLHIVTCLLETVYTHVIHAIESNEPCPTTESHPEQVESEINHCHVIDVNDTANLTHCYCVDCSNSWDLDECTPPPPPLPPVIEPPCSSHYIWETQGFFADVIAASYSAALASDNLAESDNLYTSPVLSSHDWAGCAAPQACIPCTGLAVELNVLPDPAYAEPSVECKEHETYLRPGQNNGESFRCLGTWCVPAEARCNGHSNCGDGSDELGCDTLWGVAADLRMASVEECRVTPSGFCAGFAYNGEPTGFYSPDGVCATASPVGTSQIDDVQFQCASGECTTIEARCNGFNNCADGSDEQGCQSGTEGVTLEATTGFTVTKELFSSHSAVFHDREYTFDSVGSFVGQAYIKSSNEDKHTPQSHVQMKLRLPHPTTVYVTKLDTHTLPWLVEEGPDGTPLWRVSALQGMSYSGLRQTRHKDWIVGAPHNYARDLHSTFLLEQGLLNHDGTLQHEDYPQWNNDIMQHEDWAHARDTVALNEGFLNGDAAPSRYQPTNGLTLTEDHFSTVAVYERTFPAGVVSMPGNGGGDGSYLMFVANPNTPPVPPVLSPDSQAAYLGCFVDDEHRDMGTMKSGGAIYTFASCLVACEGSRFMSLQFGGECFCADTYSTASQYVQVSDSHCDTVREPCTGSGTHNCGGTWHQAIYTIAELGDQILLHYANPDVNGNGLCVSMSTNSAGSAGCDGSWCRLHEASDATLQTCNAADAGQTFIHDVQTGQLRSFLGNNLCLHVSTSYYHGSCEPFTLLPCAAHEARQQFNVESVGGSHVWRNTATNLAIDSDSYRNTVDNWIWACGGTNTAKYFDPMLSASAMQCSVEVETSTQTHANTGSGAGVQFLVDGVWSAVRDFEDSISFNEIVTSSEWVTSRPTSLRLIAGGSDAWGYRRITAHCGVQTILVLDSENGEPYDGSQSDRQFWVDGDQAAPSSQEYPVPSTDSIQCRVEVSTSSQTHADTSTGASSQLLVDGIWSNGRNFADSIAANAVVTSTEWVSARPTSVRLTAGGTNAWGYRRIVVSCEGETDRLVLDSVNGESYSGSETDRVFWVDGNQAAPPSQEYEIPH